MLRSTQNSKNQLLSIGTVAERTGIAVSAIRFYEEQGLVDSVRSGAKHRQFERSSIRRLSFIRVCKSLGYSLEEIKTQLEKLPSKRTPTKRDWAKLSTEFSAEISQRISKLEQLKDKLEGCIGCGCLSMEACALYNQDDVANKFGPGPRYLLGNTPDL